MCRRAPRREAAAQFAQRSHHAPRREARRAQHTAMLSTMRSRKVKQKFPRQEMGPGELKPQTGVAKRRQVVSRGAFVSPCTPREQALDLRHVVMPHHKRFSETRTQ